MSFFQLRHSALMQKVAIVIFGIATLTMVWFLGMWIFFEAHSRLFGDANTFFIVGKGILNGKAVYTDLYEMKPPGIFFLSAISLWIVNNEIPLTIFKLILMSGIPLLLVGFALKKLRKTTPRLLLYGTVSAILFGCGIAIYTMERTSGLQAEPFGAFAGFLYVLIIAEGSGNEKMSWPRILLASATMLLAIGMKEPFLFCLLAAAIILARSWKEFLRTFILPFCITAIAGLILMASLGLLDPYLHIYIPDVLSGRIGADQLGSLWTRGLQGWIILQDISYAFVLPLFGVVIGILWSLVPLLKKPEAFKDWQDTVWVWLCTASGMLFVSLFFVSSLLARNLLVHTITAYRSPVIILCIVSCILFLGSAIKLFLQQRTILPCILITIAALYPVVLAIGAGFFMEHHFIAAVPVYLALFLLFLRAIAKKPSTSGTKFLLGIITGVLVLTPFIAPSVDWNARKATQRERNLEYAEGRKIARKFDVMMDQCHYSEYMPLFGYAWTEHSPIQMEWPLLRAYGKNALPYFREKTLENFSRTSVVVRNKNLHIDDEIEEILHKDFTTTPPACATDYQPPSTHVIYYRVF